MVTTANEVVGGWRRDDLEQLDEDGSNLIQLQRHRRERQLRGHDPGAVLRRTRVLPHTAEALEAVERLRPGFDWRYSLLEVRQVRKWVLFEA